MRFSTIIPALAVAAGLVSAQNNNKQGGGNNQGGGQAAAGGALVFNGGQTLDPDLVQSSDNGLADAEPGQAGSAVSNNNFIDFCSGKTITDGLQNQQGSCNPTPMGDIPAKNKMISAAFVNPKFNDVLPSGADINFQVQITNLVAGTFTNPDTTYYKAPQQLVGGAVQGHTHITVQDLQGDIETTTPPDPTVFAFFKGINDDGNGNGLLSAALVGGLADGVYRVCSMTSASNHQPVLMPVAQRGAQDDCLRFTVGGGNGGNGGNAGNAGNAGNNAGGNDNAGGQAAASSVAAAGGQNAGGNAAATSAAAAQTTAAAGGQAAGAGKGGKKGGQRFGQGGGRFGRPRKFTAREFIA